MNKGCVILSSMREQNMIISLSKPLISTLLMKAEVKALDLNLYPPPPFLKQTSRFN